MTFDVVSMAERAAKTLCRALGGVGAFWDVLIPPRIQDRTRVLESRGVGPEAVSAGLRPPAPASGHPVMETGQDHPCSIAAEFFPQFTKTSAVPPAAVDGPAVGSPQLTVGSPNPMRFMSNACLETEDCVAGEADCTCYIEVTNELMADLTARKVELDGEFDWLTWVVPAITRALANHIPMQLGPGDTVLCARADSTPCAECADWETWIDHVAPNVATRIHSAAMQQ